MASLGRTDQRWKCPFRGEEVRRTPRVTRFGVQKPGSQCGPAVPGFRLDGDHPESGVYCMPIHRLRRPTIATGLLIQEAGWVLRASGYQRSAMGKIAFRCATEFGRYRGIRTSSKPQQIKRDL